MERAGAFARDHGSGAADQRSISAGELFVAGDQGQDAFLEGERSGTGAFTAHRVDLIDGAGHRDESLCGGVEDDGLLAVFDLVADDSEAQLGQRSRGLFVARTL
jgi:hypothetical protein